MKAFLFLYCGILVFFTSCQQRATPTDQSDNNEIKKNAIPCPPGSKLDVAKIEQITGMKGTEKNGEYKITVPQNDLHIAVDGFKIIPAMGLGSWAGNGIFLCFIIV